MVTLEEFKQALGERANKMTEEDIVKLKDLQERLADVFFSIWIDKQSLRTK